MNSKNISNKLIESFGYEVSEAPSTTGAKIASQAATSAGKGVVSKLAGKAASKLIPGVGTALSVQDAYDRWKEGDRSGAVISALSAIGYLIPGPLGWGVGGGLEAANIARDVTSDDEAGVSASSATVDEKLKSLQKIIGATPDGIMGPETTEKLKAWQKSKGINPDGIPGPQTYTVAGLKESVRNMNKSLVERIAELRDNLAMIESEFDLDEGGATAITKAIWKSAKSGISSIDDLVADVMKNTGISSAELPANIKQQASHAINTVSKKAGAGAPLVNQPSRMAPDLARLGRSGETMAGIKAQELAAREAAIARMSPGELAKAGLNQAEQTSIKNGGLMAWVKQNPKKSASVLAALGLTAGSMMGTQGTGGLPAAGSGSGAKKGDPEIMKKQEMLNALTGSNLNIDGVWGPATQAAADKWAEISSAQNKDMQDQVAKIKTAGSSPAAPTTSTSTTSPSPADVITPSFSNGVESDAYKELTKNVPQAPKESAVYKEELARILQLSK